MDFLRARSSLLPDSSESLLGLSRLPQLLKFKPTMVASQAWSRPASTTPSQAPSSCMQCGSAARGGGGGAPGGAPLHRDPFKLHQRSMLSRLVPLPPNRLQVTMHWQRSGTGSGTLHNFKLN